MNSNPQEFSYFQERMQELGIVEADLPTIKIEQDYPLTKYQTIFTENRFGDIEIVYQGLNGAHFYKDGNREKPYIRTRLHPRRCTKDKKYHTPKGAGTHIFIPPLIHDLYREKTAIHTLVITEGEFKAFKACMHNIPCLGIPGIHNVLEKVGTKQQLNSEIERIITDCQVKNVVLLFDADCFEVTYSEDKDLFKRPNSFYSAVKNFREYSKHLNCDIYFAHILPENRAKGLDDLLCQYKGQEKKVNEDLFLLSQGQLFATHNITDNSLKKIREYFHIDSSDDFYARYEDILQDKPFVFKQQIYQYNGSELKCLVSSQIRNFIRVGDEYYEKIYKPDKEGNLELSLENRRKATILDDYGRGCLKYIKKYKAFCLVPSHTNFQQEIENCYNIYKPLSHIPVEGTYEKTLQMLRHIFQDKVDFILDWLTLLYCHPTQLLPILSLLSEELNTGKSTFGQWLTILFESNAVKLGNADLESSFNSHYAEKLVIVVDESAIEKKLIYEAIKRMSTEKGKILVNTKNKNQYPIDFIGKFCFISNHETNFMLLGKGENRFAVFKVPVLTKDDTNILDKLKEEIPAFLHFLMHRSLVHPRRSRMYFDFSVYHTPQLDIAIEANTSLMEQGIRQLIIDTFDMFTHLTELEMSLVDILNELKDTVSKTTTIGIRRCLKGEFKMMPQPQKRYLYHSLRESGYSSTPVNYERNGKPYLFKVENFLGAAELEKRIALQASSPPTNKNSLQ